VTALDHLSVDDFAPTVGEPYALDLDGQGTLDFTLVEARALGDGSPAGGRPPFSIVFRGPLDPQLPQRTYGIAHERLGRLLIFLVPIARDEDGMRYESVFA
jgi:hypothetical protein